MSSLFSSVTTRGSGYASVFGWNWDGKTRGGVEIARRVDGKWLVTGTEYVMFGEKPEGTELLNEVVVSNSQKAWKIRIDKQYVLPDNCVTQISSKGNVFDVVQIVGFVQIGVAFGFRYFVGCVGYDPVSTNAALFAVLPDDPMLRGIEIRVLHAKDISEEAVASSPAYYNEVELNTKVQSVIEKYDRERDELLAHIATLQSIVRKDTPTNGEAGEVVQEVVKLINELKEQLKGSDVFRDRGDSFEEEVTPKKYSDVKRRRGSRLINGKRISVLEDYNTEEEAQLKTEEALRGIKAQEDEAMLRFKFTEIDGKKVLNLSHLMANVKDEEEEAPIPHIDLSANILAYEKKYGADEAVKSKPS